MATQQIDAVLARWVREWFDLPRAPRLRIRVGDTARVAADLRAGEWDVVVQDVFREDCFYRQEDAPVIVGGRYGLSSKDMTPAQILAVYENLALPMPKNRFTIGIVNNVTFTSLPQKEEIALGGDGMFDDRDRKSVV